MIEFSGKRLTHTHGPIVRGSSEVARRTVKYWGLKGEGEIVDEPGGRHLFVEIILHNGYTQKQLLKAIAELDDLVGKNGTLKESGEVAQEFKNVTFASFEPMPLQGQEQPGPIQDVGVLTLRPDSTTLDNGWFQLFWLQFRQLKTK
jgi:hypothetical protein